MAKDDPERDRRLAEALRANLRRRKAQARDIDHDMKAQLSDRPTHPSTAGTAGAQHSVQPKTGEGNP